jgi:TfoX/Sxy family transcriptional regulator of competence genes
LEKRIDARVEDFGLAKKKMFGGICYLLQGNMCFGIYRDFLIVRLGSAAAAEPYLAQAHVKPMDITGRPMKGWVMVAPTAYDGPEQLRPWLSRGMRFAQSLPPK